MPWLNYQQVNSVNDIKQSLIKDKLMCPKCQLSWKRCTCDITEPDDPAPAIAPAKTEIVDPILPFGRHMGQRANTVDVYYLDWMLGIADEPFKTVLQDHLEGRPDWQNLDSDD